MAADSAPSGLHRRPVAAAKARSGAGGGPHPDIDPPPRPRPVLQYAAFALIFFLACLQFRAATHFRDPSDPTRSWIPIDPTRSDPIVIEPKPFDEGGGQMHIFSSTDCMDLRMLSVLANSTLSSSRYNENIYFHFLVPENEDAKLSYYKLKVIFPYSNIKVIGQKEVKKLLIAPSGKEPIGSLLNDLAPFVIPRIRPFSTKRMLYVSSNIIIKGNVAELFDIDLGPYAIAAAEDCRRRLGDYISIDVVNAIQRTNAKPWVSNKPYDKDSCLPDLNILVIEVLKLNQDVVDAILWWSKVLNLPTESNNVAVALAIYGNYLKLPASWKLHPTSSDNKDEVKILNYDGPTRMCSNSKDKYEASKQGNIWVQHLSPNSESILSMQN